MYTLIPARPLSVCSSGVGRSSWRGGAGIIKPWRGTSGTLLSAIRGSSQRMLIFLRPVNVQPGLFSIGTRGPGLAWESPPHTTRHPTLLRAAYSGCWYWVKQTLSQGCPVGHSAKVANGSHMWRLPKEGNEASIHTHCHYYFFSFPLYKFDQKQPLQTSELVCSSNDQALHLSYPPILEIVYFQK